MNSRDGARHTATDWQTSSLTNKLTPHEGNANTVLKLKSITTDHEPSRKRQANASLVPKILRWVPALHYCITFYCESVLAVHAYTSTRSI